jgi:outer membrane protein assembly factor BamA
MPYINNKKTLGAGFGFAVELNHELPVLTVNNEPFYIRSSSTYLKKLIGGFAELNLRPDFYCTHTFRLAYSHYDFDSAVQAVPGFVVAEQEVQQFVSLSYLYKNDHRDVQYYPLKGYCMDVELNHAIPYETAHNSYIRTNLRMYLQLFNRWYWASGFTGKLSFEKVQPYYLQRGLGYGRDFVRGYEYYVVDGQHFALLKNNLKFALVPQHVEKLGFIRTTKFNTIPLALYMNAFIDMGFVYHYADSPGDVDSGNTLENSFLIGYGLGLDFTTYYDVVIRLEGSMNRMGQPGLYLHFIAPI